ncbi:proline racemase family protein [Desulfopila sp. IMCC35008]|uniref:proline racemase family protein n=1 Tax=Desulfopila sp. IMCC35008 TaxID=2653858 RepID=UPI0013D3F313|nr:proline racemase family protein [Desulfopila sp. IMCC35008]
MVRADRMQKGFMNCYPERIVTVDSHTQGEPTRLIISGFDEPQGATMREKRTAFAKQYDHVRKILTMEPRGHRDMFAAAVTEPVSKQADFGLIYMDAQRYPYLCGHATIGAVTTLAETGAITLQDGQSVVTVDTPSGPIEAHANVEHGKVVSVGIDMVPSFVFDTNCKIDVPGFGALSGDLVCVGGFFIMISAKTAGLKLHPAESRKLTRLGMAIIEAANQQLKVHHPQRPEVETIDVVEFYDEGPEAGEGSSVVVYGASHMDRSPCGTGTSAKMTLLHHKGRLAFGDQYRNRSPLGTFFTGQIRGAAPIGTFPAVTANIRGSARITGYHQFVVDDRDPFPEGFLL